MSFVNGPSPSERGGGDIIVSSKAIVFITKKAQTNNTAAKMFKKSLGFTINLLSC
jgi:hypothetical protein